MAVTVYYGTPPYDRPFRLYQLSGSYYNDRKVCIGPGQVQNDSFGAVYSFPDNSGATGYYWLTPNLVWVPQGSLDWVQFYVVSGGTVSQQNVAASNVVFPSGSLPLCVVGLDSYGFIKQLIDARTYSQPGNKLDWWP